MQGRLFVSSCTRKRTHLGARVRDNRRMVDGRTNEKQTRMGEETFLHYTCMHTSPKPLRREMPLRPMCTLRDMVRQVTQYCLKFPNALTRPGFPTLVGPYIYQGKKAAEEGLGKRGWGGEAFVGRRVGRGRGGFKIL